MPVALLIIDVQQALCSGDGAVFDSQGVIDRINRVAAGARGAGAPVFLIQHEAAGTPFAYNTPGWQLAEGLETRPTDISMRKTATDAFHRTPLQALLQERDVDALIICGLQSDFCVDTTTRRALALGYPVTLVSDAHSTVDNAILRATQISAHHTATLANIASFGPRVTPQTSAACVARLADFTSGRGLHVPCAVPGTDDLLLKRGKGSP